MGLILILIIGFQLRAELKGHKDNGSEGLVELMM